tara:strand:- start:546 stop:725 length:180 start_codon:yes stop_codon:yes gene_type:complete
MKTNIIKEEDVSRVARDLNIIMNKTQVQKVLELYDDAQTDDPTSNWSEVVESIIYNINN